MSAVDSVHVVFCVDNSGSMGKNAVKGDRCSATRSDVVRDCVVKMVQQQLDSLGEAGAKQQRISLLLFNDTVRRCVEEEPLSPALIHQIREVPPA